MAYEEQKDFNAMLHDSKDMPKIQVITDRKSIEKYGGSRMYFAPPIDYDTVMKQVPFGQVVTVGTIRDHFARKNGADLPSRSRRASSCLSWPGPASSAQGMRRLIGGR